MEKEKDGKIDKLQLLMNDHKESHVGKQLGDTITIKVIILVLAMIFVTPVFTAYQYIDAPTFFDFGLQTIAELGGSSTEAGKLAFNNLVSTQG